MKYKLLIFTVIIAAVFMGCNGSSGSSGGEVNFDKDASYALGLNIGAGLRNDLRDDGIFPNIDEFLKGMKDALTGREPRFDLFDAREKIEIAFDAIMAVRGTENMQREIAFLAENAGKPGIQITSTGLQYEVLTEGTGRRPSSTDVVQVHYEGRLIDGTLFDNSYEHGAPVQFPLDRVITGWSEGLQLMRVGSRYRFFIPSELGYGQFGFGPIPGNATLIFTVELLDIIE